MRIKTSVPVEQLSGTVSNSQLVYQPYADGTVARAKVKSRRPASPDQAAIRMMNRTAMEQWSLLPAPVRQAWQEWAQRWHLTSRSSGHRVEPSGQMCYVRAAIMRQIIGMSLPEGEPVPVPPPELFSARPIAMPGAPETTYAFEVALPPAFPRCGEADAPDYMVLARITPATPTLACGPRDSKFRYIAGVGPESAVPLPLDPTQPVVFSGARRAVPPGARFGHELCLVRTADGMPGPWLRGDSLRP